MQWSVRARRLIAGEVIVKHLCEEFTVERMREWQQTIPDSRLQVLPGKPCHVAASDAEACAQTTLDFIKNIPRR